MYGENLPAGARIVKSGPVDFASVKALALSHAEKLVKSWLPGGRREGSEWVARNPTRADNKPGSFKINLATGEWTDFATDAKGGDLISAHAYLNGSSHADAARKIAAELDLEISQISAGLTLEAYAEAKHLPVEFLRKLGLVTVADPWGKRRHVLSIPYRKRDRSLHRCRLRLELGKPPSGGPRMVWDKRTEKTGALLYGLDVLPPKGCPVLLVEGESDAHTLWHHGLDAVATPGSACYAPLRDDGELDGFEITALIEPDKGGEAMLRQLAKSRHRAHVKVARLDGFKDVSELHCRAPERFGEVLKAALANAEPLQAALARLAPLANAIGPATPPERQDIKLAAGEQARITDEALGIIRGDENLFERGGVLARLSGELLAEIDEHWLADYFARRASFYRMKERDGEFVRVECDPPSWLGKRIIAKRGERGLPELAGIISAPTLRPDGSLLDTPGYDPATGLLLKAGAWPKTAEKPSQSELDTAWSKLWLPFTEFPYVSDDDRSVVAAAILTAIVRRTLPLAPAFSFDAPAPSSGKTLLAQCIGALCGGEPSLLGECEEEEIRKRLLAVLLDGNPVLLMDNIKGTFKSSTLEAFLTAPRYSDRVLGASKLAKLPTNVLLLISGNNFVPGGDLWRRILTCRIDPRTEAAHLRTFRLDALGHVRSRRQEMVAAGLTLLRGFLAAGAPCGAEDRLGSYEVWDGLVRQCVIWMGGEGIAPLTDPVLSVAKSRELEPELQKLRAFLTAAHAAMGENRWRVADLVAKANAVTLAADGEPDLHGALAQIAGNDNQRINVRILGAWISKQTGRRCDGLRVERAGIADGFNRWRIVKDEK